MKFLGLLCLLWAAVAASDVTTATPRNMPVKTRAPIKTSVDEPIAENVLCALLHLQVPAAYWLSENTFVALQKIIEPLTDEKREEADEKAAELLRAKKLDNLSLKQQAISDDEFSAVCLHEVILSLRRRELEKLNRVFSGLRDPPKYMKAHSNIIKSELAALTERVEEIRTAVGKRTVTHHADVAAEEVQKILDDHKRQGTSNNDIANAHIPADEHKLKNVVEMDEDTLYREKVRDLRRRIEGATRASDKKALRGELASLYQKHSNRKTPARRQGVYRTLKGETPAQVAELLGIDVNKLLVANVANRPDLKPWTKLDQGSPLVIPKVLLHRSQQRMQEQTATGEARNEARRTQSLHSDLLKAVEARDYKTAAMLADVLHGTASEDQDSQGTRAGKTSRGKNGARKQNGKNKVDKERQKEPKRAKKATTKATRDKKAKRPTAGNPEGFVTARAMTVLVDCAACAAPIRIENVHRCVFSHEGHNHVNFSVMRMNTFFAGT